MDLTYQMAVLGLGVVMSGMAGWREKHDAEVHQCIKELKAMLRDADLSHKEAAGIVDIAPAQWCRNVEQGGNLTELVIIARRNPVFGAALALRLLALLGMVEHPDVTRQQRLEQAIDALRPQKATLKQCNSRASSAA